MISLNLVKKVGLFLGAMALSGAIPVVIGLVSLFDSTILNIVFIMFGAVVEIEMYSRYFNRPYLNIGFYPTSCLVIILVGANFFLTQTFLTMTIGWGMLALFVILPAFKIWVGSIVK